MISYLLFVNYIKINSANDIEFVQYTKDFKDSNPLYARELALRSAENLKEVLLESGSSLDIFWGVGREQTIEGRSLSIPMSFDKGIYVFLKTDDPIPENADFREQQNNGFLIHGYGSNFPDTQYMNILNNLLYEKDLFFKLKLISENDLASFNVFDTDTWQVENKTILKTPIDWNQFQKEPEDDDELPQDEIEETELGYEESLSDLISKGEGRHLEFKPFLAYNIHSGKGSIAVHAINARSIASFLNSGGGFLIIGVDDNGKVHGLENDYLLYFSEKNVKDAIIRNLDALLKKFFKPEVSNYVVGRIISLDEKDVLVVEVNPAKSPMLLLNENRSQFIIRFNATTKELQTPEEIINYIKDKWL